MPSMNRRVRQKLSSQGTENIFFSTEYCLRAFLEDLSTDKKSSIFEEGKEEVKRATFPTLLTMIVG